MPATAQRLMPVNGSVFAELLAPDAVVAVGSAGSEPVAADGDDAAGVDVDGADVLEVDGAGALEVDGAGVVLAGALVAGCV
jgi:hypothetical protein